MMDDYLTDKLARWLLGCRKLGQMLDNDPRLVRLPTRRGTVSGAPDIARELGGFVISMADHHSETAFPTLDQLAVWTGHGRTSVSHALDWLVDEYYLARVSGKKGRASRYRPIPETAHGFVLGDEKFWNNFLTPENSSSSAQVERSSSAQVERSSSAQVERESQIWDREKTSVFSPSPSAPAPAGASASASSDFGFGYFWSLLKRFGRIGQFHESRKSLKKKYMTALTYPDVTDENLCTGYHASLQRYYGKKNFTYPGEWLGNPDNYTGLEKSEPSATNKRSKKTGRKDSLGPVREGERSAASQPSSPKSTIEDAKAATLEAVRRQAEENRARQPAKPKVTRKVAEQMADDILLPCFSANQVHATANALTKNKVLVTAEAKAALGVARVSDLDSRTKCIDARDRLLAAVNEKHPKGWREIFIKNLMGDVTMAAE